MSQIKDLARSTDSAQGRPSTSTSWPVPEPSHVSLSAGSGQSGDHSTHVSDSNSSHNESSNSNEKPLLNLFKSHRDPTQPRQWKASLIRFGPLSGIFCMLLAVISIVASLGILAGSNKQAVASWSTSPSTYLAIFTAIANLSIRYAAIQGVAVAWWYRATKGSTLSKLHWDWRAGTTLRGALTSGRHVGLLGLACIFSVIVVIDGPLLQRASTVISAPIKGVTAPLKILMSPQIPHDYSGSWVTYAGVSNQAFNDTVPTISGDRSNHVEGLPTHSFWSQPTISRELTESFYGDKPIEGAVQGCEGRKCKALIRAPALFPTCRTSSVAIDSTEPWDWNAALRGEMAPPVYAQGFSIGATLVTSDKHEWMSLVVSNSVMEKSGCTGVLYTTMCSLESAVGEYSVEVIDNNIQMQDLQMPVIISISNNTQVEPSYHGVTNYHSSTLGGINYMAWQKWYSMLFKYPQRNNATNTTTSTVFSGVVPWTLIVQPDTASYECSSYLNVTEDILISLNKLVVYMGAHAAAHPGPPGQMHLDPGLSMRNNATGQVIGEESKFSTNYWFFLAAAVVEVVCIALIAPTYWGWWKLGRSVSLSPLELAKAFESPMLATSNSNSSGRDIAKAFKDVPVQYGATSIEDEQGSVNPHGKLAFSDPAAVATPQNGSRFTV